MEAKILALLKENLPDIDFESSDKLVDDEILDSISLFDVITLLSDEFRIEFPIETLDAKNFNSVRSMALTVKAILG